MSNWKHVDKEEIIISEDGLDEAIHNAYLKGRNDALDKIRVELHATAEMHEDGHYYLREKWIDEIFDKYKA